MPRTGGTLTRREFAVLLILCMAIVGTTGAANYMYEKATVKGVGYKNVETIIQTQYGLDGNKLLEKESGSGNVIIEKTEIEAIRDYENTDPQEYFLLCPDRINFTKEAEFEYSHAPNN